MALGCSRAALLLVIIMSDAYYRKPVGRDLQFAVMVQERWDKEIETAIRKVKGGAAVGCTARPDEIESPGVYARQLIKRKRAE